MARRGDDGRSKRRLEGYGEDGGVMMGAFKMMVVAGTSRTGTRAPRATRVVIGSSASRSCSSRTTGGLRPLGGSRSKSGRRRRLPQRAAAQDKARVLARGPVMWALRVQAARVANRARRSRRSWGLLRLRLRSPRERASPGKGKSGDGPPLLSSGECFKCGRGGHF
jgi:hypothetical protein